MKRYKLGFIGGGDSIAGYPHLIASQMDGRFEVIGGIFSQDRKKSEDIAQKYQVKSFEDLDKLIESVDAVSILTPTPLHFKDISYLLERKKPIICEKPLVSSLEDAIKIKELLKDDFLVVTNNYSGYPMIREMKKMLEDGLLGEILTINLQMPQETFLRPPKSIKYPQKWRLKDGYIPMISLDLGVHLHHLAYFLLGIEPQKVFGEFNSYSSYDVIDDVKMLLKYKNNSTASLWISKVALGHRNGLKVEIYGTKASVVWIQEEPENLYISYSDGKKIKIDRGSNCLVANEKRYNRMTPGHPSGFIEAFANLYGDIADSLDRYFQKQEYITDYVYGIDHAINGLKLLNKAKKSYEDGRWIDLKESI